MNTIKVAIQSDWAPTIKSIARALGYAVAISIILAQWAHFTTQRPWAGLQAVLQWRAAVVPVPAPEPLLLMPMAPLLMLAAAPEPIPAAPAPTPRRRGRRATRQPKAAT